MKSFILSALAAASFSTTLVAQDTLALWTTPAPGAPPVARPERLIERPADTLRGPITRVSDIDRPTITWYAATGQRTGAAVLVFPGGGYQYLAIDIEGTDICRWLSSNGIACGVVKYRVPQVRSAGSPRAPLQDAQRAIRLVRSRARELGVDPGKIGVMGFSAGGHVAALASNHFSEDTYPAADAVDRESARPDFALLIYPAYLVTDAAPRRLAADVQPTPRTPPTFLVQTDDDPIGVANSVEYARALRDVGVPAELHEYPSGGHGYGMRPRANAITAVWPGLAARWIGSRE